MKNRIAAIDIGDKWHGVALSDSLCLFAKPYKTVEETALEQFLTDFIVQQSINIIVIGYPLTLRGTISDQTKRVIEKKEHLQRQFPDTQFVFWDERLTSKLADQLKHAKTKEEKIKSHSVASAFILQSYLDAQKNVQQSYNSEL